MFKRLLLLFFIIFSVFNSRSQDSVGITLKPKKNLVKLNVVGIALSGQYERLLTQHIAIGFSYKTIPWGGVPFRSMIGSRDPNTQETLNKLNFFHHAFTPELRFYFGKKGYGKGFCVSPFYRSASYSAGGLGLDFVTDSGLDDTLRLSARIRSSSFGLLLGAQWNLAKRFVLDVQFFGPHYGSSKLKIEGKPQYAMSAEQQENLEALGQLFAEEAKTSLSSAGIPFLNETVVKRPDKITLTANSVWAGVRTGISLGWRF